MIHGVRNGRLRLLAAGLAVASAVPASAAPVTDFSGSASLGVTAASNPFLVDDGSTSSVSVDGSVLPRLSFTTPTAVTAIDGSYSRSEYFRRYRNAEGYSAGLSHDNQLSSQLRANANVGYSSSITALTDPVDFGAFNTRVKRRLFTAAAGLVWTPDARSTISVGGNYAKATYPDNAAFAFDYEQYGGTLGYSRALSETLSVGVSMGATRSTSESGIDTDIYQPSVNVSKKLSALWTLNGSVGAFFRTSDSSLGHEKSTSLAFSGELCRADVRSTACFRASRDTAASGIGDVRTVTSASADWTYSLTERTTVSANLAYSRTSSPDFLGVVFPPTDYFAGTGRIDRRLDAHLSAGAFAAYRLRKFGGQDTDDLSGGISLTYNWGRNR